MEAQNYKNKNEQIKNTIPHQINSEIQETKSSEKDIFQEKMKKMFLEKENNNLKNEINGKNISNNLKTESTDIFGISNTFKNISYENINKYKELIDINSRYIEPIEKSKKMENENELIKDEMKTETKKDNNNENKKERNKLLLKLLVNKELSRISTISKELRLSTKKLNTQEKINNEKEKQIDGGIENKDNKNSENSKNLDTKSEIKEKNEIIDINTEEEKNNINNNSESKTNKEDALRIIELLKIKNNSKKDNIEINKERNNDNNRIINININTNHNIITQNGNINQNLTQNNIDTNFILSKKNIKPNNKGDILHQYINNENDNNKYIYINDYSDLENEDEKENKIIDEININQRNTFQPVNKNNNIYVKNKNIFKNNNNLNEKIRRKKLENDLAIEINKNELSGEWNKDNNKGYVFKKNIQNIKTAEITFTKENLNNTIYNNMNSFDKNATIQFSLNETNANINEKINLKKAYSKKI